MGVRVRYEPGGAYAVDFTRMAVDGQVVFFTGNMFDPKTGAFFDALARAASKASMENGFPVVPRGFGQGPPLKRRVPVC